MAFRLHADGGYPDGMMSSRWNLIQVLCSLSKEPDRIPLVRVNSLCTESGSTSRLENEGEL